MRWFSLIILLYKSFFIHSQSYPLLLIISFHGFRFDYPSLYGSLGNFSRLEQRGVRAYNLIPSFNTATYPNHYTLVTGLYEEVHGLISDQIYDPKTKSIFQSGNNMSGEWWPWKSIWTINEQRFGARSGVIGWPQDSLKISKYEKYDENRSYKDIINRMLNWFNDANEPINLGGIYFSEPGLTGYKTGPYSEQMNETLRKCDEYLGYLLNEIEKNLLLKTNLHLILTSDHGLEQINATQQPLFLEDFVNINKIQAYGSETVLNIFVNSRNDMNEIFKNLSQIPHSKTYKKGDIPERYHYRTNSRIGDLLIVLEPGYELYRRSFYGGNRVYLNMTHGNHGYDNQLDSMKTIFYATGPQLKLNYTLSNTSVLYNVDIFPLMCLILDIDKCPSSNGSLKNIQSVLIDSHRIFNLMEKETEKLQDGPMGLVIYLFVLVSFVLILIMAFVWSAVSFRNASAMARVAYPDPTTLAEQNQYKFTQINDLKLNPIIGDENL